MKYKDNKFIKYQDRQRLDLDNWEIKSNRQIRREAKRIHDRFYTLILKDNIDIHWWNNIKSSERDEIMRLFDNRMNYVKINNDNKKNDHSTLLKKFFEHIKDNFKPDKSGLREDRLKSIGV